MLGIFWVMAVLGILWIVVASSEPEYLAQEQKGDASPRGNTMAPEEDLDALKKRKEIEKLLIDIENAKASLGLERFKTFAAILGPVMAAITVLGTVYLGFAQISAKSDSDEDANWRQTISSLQTGKTSGDVSPHVATLLKPFLDSPRYRTLAIGVTIDELPRVRDVGTFETLFTSTFRDIRSENLPILLNLNRRLTDISRDLSNAAQSEDDRRKANALRDEAVLVHGMSSTLCDPIATILRTTDHKLLLQKFSSNQKVPARIPLDNIYFERCDFSNIDFSDADLTASAFDWVALDNANLTHLDDPSKYLWAGNIWWKAKAIDGKLLQILIAQFKPYMIPEDFGQKDYRYREEIDPAEWKSDVMRLCKAAQISCTEEQIKADFPKQK
jgi:Pentapeptide repeats (8 copies)